MSQMLEEAGQHLRNLDDTIIKQQHLSERCLGELEEKLNNRHEVRDFLEYVCASTANPEVLY